jgi:gluconokinase
MSPEPPHSQIVLVMGVAGSGKTTIARGVAGALAWAFAEGDEFHPAANVSKMAAGVPLTDDDRWPWLDAIGRWIADCVARGQSAVVACSALKRAYRDRLRETAPDLRLVYLETPRTLLESRVAGRAAHFFPAALIGSQFADLEPPRPDERAIVVSTGESAERVVARVLERLTPGAPAP